MDGAQHGNDKLALGGCDDAAHLKACSVKDCSRCKWAQHKGRWQEELPWLDAKIHLEQQKWGIGCKLCSEAQRLSRDTMAKFPVSRHHFARYEVTTGNIRAQRFRKHANSPAHRTELKAWHLAKLRSWKWMGFVRPKLNGCQCWSTPNPTTALLTFKMLAAGNKRASCDGH
eukprot:s225_g20.t1